MSPVALVNGHLADGIDWRDRGFQYGDGVFTTLQIRDGRPLLFDRHIERLQRDTQRLGLAFDSFEELTNEAHLLCRQYPGVLKIQLTRGVGGRGYRPPIPVAPTRVLSIHPPPMLDPGLWQLGIALRICSLRLGLSPILAGVKHMNRLEQVIARSEWTDDRIHEGLLLDAEGAVVEGTMSNLFVVRHGRLETPLIDRCGVLGVMRNLVVEQARRDGILVEERRLGMSDLDEADELFMTNSLIHVWPVSRLVDRSLTVGPVTRRIMRLVENALVSR